MSQQLSLESQVQILYVTEFQLSAYLQQSLAVVHEASEVSALKSKLPPRLIPQELGQQVMRTSQERYARDHEG